MVEFATQIGFTVDVPAGSFEAKIPKKKAAGLDPIGRVPLRRF